MKAALVIMAAGMGSRYGGSKQVDGIGPDGEILMEYSIYDAIRAGFTKVVFIIKPEMRELVETLCGRRVAGMTAADGSPVEVCYAYQDFSSVPAFYSIPTERTKPFGTGHAVLCARSCVGEPFIVINADDYYGVDAFRVIYEELGRLEAEGEATMVGYRLDKTVSEHGSVTRGVCHVTDGTLDRVVETFKLTVFPDGTTPVYWWGMSAQLKLIIDKCYCRGLQLKNKKVGTIVVGGSPVDSIQYELIDKQFDCMAKYLSWNLLFQKSYYATAKDELSKNQDAMKELEDIGKEL